MSTVVVKRPPRVHPPQVPTGEVYLEPPPELARTVKDGGAVMQALPMLASVGSVAFFFMPGTNVLMKMMGGMTLMSSLGFVVMSLVKGKGGGKGKTADARRDYLRYLSQMRQQVRKTQQQQYTAQMWSHPSPAHLWAIVTSGQRLWERRPTDADFVQVRLGSGGQRLITPLVAPETAPVDELEPVCADALRRFITGIALLAAAQNRDTNGAGQRRIQCCDPRVGGRPVRRIGLPEWCARRCANSSVKGFQSKQR